MPPGNVGDHQNTTEINAKLGVPAPGFAGGLDYVPYDIIKPACTRAKVLTAKAREYSGGGFVNMPTTINGGSKRMLRYVQPSTNSDADNRSSNSSKRRV